MSLIDVDEMRDVGFDCDLNEIWAVNNVKKWIRKKKNLKNPHCQPDKKGREMNKQEAEKFDLQVSAAKENELKAWDESGSVQEVKFDPEIHKNT